MAAGAERTRAAIAPGSTEYGERASLEAAIGQAGAGGGGPAAPIAGGGGAASALPSPTDPLGALLSGSISPEEKPLTDGLSFGPGAGPTRGDDPLLSDYAQRLRTLATEAASPMLRAAARTRLRRMSRTQV